MIDDLEIPMWAGEDQALQEAKKKRDEHWARMRSAREWWIAHNRDVPFDNFWIWLLDTYGIKPHRNAEGNITSGIDTLDEKKYTLFLLKFGQ